jgi:hypothetical protein
MKLEMDPLPLFHGCIDAAKDEDGGVVDQDVDLAVDGQGLRDHTLDISLVSHIGVRDKA